MKSYHTFARVRHSFQCSIEFLCDNRLLNQYLIGLAETNNIDDENTSFGNIERGFSAMIGPLVNLAGSLFGSNRMY